MNRWLRLLRPGSWTKNLLVFAALLFAGRWHDPRALGAALLVGVGFCLLASMVYILNDWLDRKRDRLHPDKQDRPLASGEINAGQALLVEVALALGVGTMLLLLPGSRRPGVALVFGVYGVLMLGYNAGLKHVLGLDVLIVSVGILLRALAGGVGIGVKITHWFTVCVFFLALLLVAGKRRFELSQFSDDTAPDHRPVLARYTRPLLDRLITISGASAVVTYSLWTVTERSAERFSSDVLPYSIVFVVYGLIRYLSLIYEGGGAPERLFVKDGPLVLCVLLWSLFIGLSTLI